MSENFTLDNPAANSERLMKESIVRNFIESVFTNNRGKFPLSFEPWREWLVELALAVPSWSSETTSAAIKAKAGERQRILSLNPS